MGDLVPGRGGTPSRRSREQRAYRLVVAGGTVPLVAAVVAVICAILFRRTVAR
ncbi:MAG TPA: hypothetical protein VLA98_08870 [Solirubrobacteraceae bacterium]|nr:hypothetical protein [Solirubrobacteraceae bacterium]